MGDRGARLGPEAWLSHTRFPSISRFHFRLSDPFQGSPHLHLKPRLRPCISGSPDQDTPLPGGRMAKCLGSRRSWPPRPLAVALVGFHSGPGGRRGSGLVACLRARSVLLQLLPSLRDCTEPHQPQPLRDQTQARLPGSEPRLCHPHWGISGKSLKLCHFTHLSNADTNGGTS